MGYSVGMICEDLNERTPTSRTFHIYTDYEKADPCRVMLDNVPMLGRHPDNARQCLRHRIEQRLGETHWLATADYEFDSLSYEI